MKLDSKYLKIGAFYLILNAIFAIILPSNLITPCFNKIETEIDHKEV